MIPLLHLQDTYLPYLLRSKLKLLFERGDGQDDLAAFIDSAMKIPERRALLEVCLLTNPRGSHWANFSASNQWKKVSQENVYKLIHKVWYR